jgi:hypothetical protein
MRVHVKALIAAAADSYAAAATPASTAAAHLLRSTSDESVDAQPKSISPPLAAVLASLPSGPLRDALTLYSPCLNWTTGEGELAGRLASAEIAGPDGLQSVDNLRVGLFLQSPQTFYPSHSHAAEELYLVLSGTPLWQKDTSPFTRIASGSAVHHLPYQRHAMKTDGDPLFAFWLWTGDLSFASYRFHEMA